MIYIGFILAAAFTVWSAVKLSSFADVIGERTSLGGMMAGTLLLAGATSLPEVTTSLTAVYVENPEIAVSNVFGSNMFNILILAVFDFVYRRKMIMSQIDFAQGRTAILSFLLSVLIMTAVLTAFDKNIINIGVEMFILLLLYIVGMRIISRKQTSLNDLAKSATENYHTRAISLQQAKKGFFISAVIIFIAGSLLTVTGDAIAEATGLSSSFIGTFLIAGATSLPEVITVLVAIQLTNYQLAIGNILGSNLFNLLILIVSDIAYRNGSILTAVDPAVAWTIGAGLVLHLIVLSQFFALKHNLIPKTAYALPSTLIIIVYLIASAVIFTFS
ncbi:sodium:calcium antiporter [Salisediminibacterium halotolerans]|uniref:sodium:calcium antiporter n=1 Tax=Salisediminibacterium halotolerans TaxID=517425 RepID=UPI000EB3AF03|nr:sodium:calcium antiporter [Salisediminibacterium halotolerans]RLJ74446.1 cation:H+ antiporter [Actinophytocola xinjiangensis]RPE87461.1 cation:H+ antiporter [Salisediminibacterium halotolerans]TWG35282.1 cation:H+ antiporter [Salisediminibacterium halotolerans]GEL06764.1 sodium/calcium exchanger membrane protein [Salisediminibacterium halotolerans]